MKPTIFVNVAAYREFDLANTLTDCLARAEDASRLHICVCWQRSDAECLGGLDRDPRVDIIDVPYQESRGVCWARNSIQRRYGGQTYTLQIDGHHRFAPLWDRTLIDMLEQLRRGGVAKPIISGYAPSFEPWNDPNGRSSSVWGTGFDRFQPHGVVFMRPFTLPMPAPSPVPARFWSAHFSFTIGAFNEEVLIDPSGYFHSEEIVMGVRAWTHGYDIFTPHETVIWHEPTRRGRTCHWDDHPDWTDHHSRAVTSYRRQFGVDGTPQTRVADYGFGKVRSLREYERFSGLDFACRGVQPHTVAHGVPPDPSHDASDDEWRASLLISYSADLSFERAHLEAGDCALGVFANEEDGTEVFREDYQSVHVKRILSGQRGERVDLPVTFCGRRRPHTWTLWPYSEKQGWHHRVSGAWPQPAPSPPLDRG